MQSSVDVIKLDKLVCRVFALEYNTITTILLPDKLQMCNHSCILTISILTYVGKILKLHVCTRITRTK